MRRSGSRRISPSCRSYCGSRNQISGIDSSARRATRYLSFEVWPLRQARNVAVVCSRVSALLNLGGGFVAGAVMMGFPLLTPPPPCRRMRLRFAIRDQFTRPDITHFLRQQQLMVIMMVVAVTVRRAAAHED